MTWNPNNDDVFRAITITDGNVFAIARELSKFDMDFGPADFMPFLKDRVGREYEIRMLMEEALHWGFHQRVEAVALHNIFVDNYVQISVDDDGDFEYFIFNEEEKTLYETGSTTRRLDKLEESEGTSHPKHKEVRCMEHTKYKGVRLTERAKQCPACVEVYQQRQDALKEDDTNAR